MKKLYMSSIFFDPSMLFISVMLWHWQEEKNFIVLTTLIVLPVILHFTGFKGMALDKSRTFTERKYLTVFETLSCLFYVGLYKKKIIIETNALIETINIVFVSSSLFYFLFFSIDFTFAAPICFALPFLTAIIYSKINTVKFFVENT